VLALFDQVSAFPAGHLKRKDELCLLEGLSCVANSLPDFEAVCRAAERLINPVQARLAASCQIFAAAAAAAGPGGAAAAASGAVVQAASEQRKEVQGALETFQELSRKLTTAPPPQLTPQTPTTAAAAMMHPAMKALQSVWTSLDTCLSVYASSDQMVEAVCRSYKIVIRAAGGRHFAPVLGEMVSLLLRHFAAAPNPAELYIASILITEFGNRKAFSHQEFDAVLLDMFTRFSEAVFSQLSSLDAFTAKPQLVEEYFYLVSRFLQHCPTSLLASPLLGAVLQCAVVGLEVDHREAHSGVVSTFYHTVAAGVESGRKAPAVASVLAQWGSLVVGGLLGCLSSEHAAYGLDKAKSNPGSVLWQISLLSWRVPRCSAHCS